MMTQSKGLLLSSVARKNLMALTGLFIIFFLVIHLIGNMILILPEGFFPVQFWGGVANTHDMYNAYSHFLVSFWPVSLVAWLLYAAIFVHIIDAVIITITNRKAQGEKYQVSDYSSSTWYSRNMGLLGTIIGFFIVIHMAQFWLQYKVLGTEHDLHKLVIETFSHWWYVLLYEIGIIALGLHLVHGIESAHSSLGFYPDKTNKVIKSIASCFGFALAVLYAIIPIVLYFK